METKQALTEEAFLDFALAEDIGDGDQTTLATIDGKEQGKAVVRAKENGVICGTALAVRIFRRVDPSISCKVLVEDGSEAASGAVLVEAAGPVASLLTAERLVLNCMQRMSGIATATRRLVRQLEGTGARLLDTRKTTPNFRAFEKQAVAAGGGFNHRFGLYDMILIKNNHVDACGGIGPAIKAARAYLSRTGRSLPIEVETRNLKEVQEALNEGGINRIMLDNFSVEAMKEAVQWIGGRVETEASGNMKEETIRSVALTGVNYISVGAITHSFRSLDISMSVISNSHADAR